MPYRLTLATCLLALSLPATPQLPGNAVKALPSINTQTISRMPQKPAADIQPSKDLPALPTGAEALIDRIPDANTLAPDMTSLIVLDNNGQAALTEVYIQHGWRAIKQEWLLLIEADRVAELHQLPLRVLSSTELPHLDMMTVRILADDSHDNLIALEQSLTPLGVAIIERHHVYDVQTTDLTVSTRNTSEPAVASEKLSTQVSIGVIDTAFDHQHSGLSQATIQARSFVRENMTEPTAHGTAVLGRLVGNTTAVKPLLPAASVFAASVFYQKDAYSQSAPTLALLKALDWLLGEQVSVINMSLAGPPNALLEKALERVRAQGIAVVAASGNAGPASRPLFPAAYPSVIAVSAVDQTKQIYRWANRGKHIDFVAVGVNVNTLRSGGDEGTESGTSMATPVISAALALQMTSASLDESLVRLQKDSQDLGKPGRDVIFGHGFIDLKP